MEKFEKYEDAVNSAATKIESLKAPSHKSVSFTCNETLSDKYDLTEDFQKIVDDHIEPLKAFALQKGMPFLLVAIPEITEEGYKSLALGYMPGVRKTPLMTRLNKVVEAEKEDKLYDAEAQAITDLGDTLNKRIADAFEKGTPTLDDITEIIKATITVKLMMLLIEGSGNSCKTAYDLLSNLVGDDVADDADK